MPAIIPESHLIGNLTFQCAPERASASPKPFSIKLLCCGEQLRKLEKESAIASEVIPQEGRPNKKLYKITDKGIEMLKTWLLEPAEPMAIREELLVKVIAAKLVPKSVILQEIKRHHQIHSQKLSEYKQIEQQKFTDTSQLTFEQKCLYATLRCGIGYESYRIAWCEEAISLGDFHKRKYQVLLSHHSLLCRFTGMFISRNHLRVQSKVVGDSEGRSRTENAPIIQTKPSSLIARKKIFMGGLLDI